MNSANHFREIEKELETLHRGVASQHKNLVDYYGAYSHEGSVFIVLECMDGSLAELKQIPERILAPIAKQILSGLQYLIGTRHLIHRDIKPSNLLYRSDGHIKITDFGVSSQVDNTQGCANTFVGTVTYMSPERLNGGAHDSTGDIWALGISLAELAMGRHPFEGLAADNTGGNKFWSLYSHFTQQETCVDLSRLDASEDFKQFIATCCEKDPTKRPRATELLEHPWITKNCAVDSAVDERTIADWLRQRTPVAEGAPAAVAHANAASITAALDELEAEMK